ncbi:DNA internalization-related competence protein ComEC/Rec2 [Paenibacillus sp. CAA11]|uniref:DNA internalization-related competence protein ComEC/Rec2 n=1 Tax=Paenibacillus sp. CAA11 TaxID=1532905 RepID=UPI000D3AB942|nr:DNA internalization-related competence protein ComEC/Rec2 [Paenibacillus sp. CAA11]AWB45441.1 DNA internalization-related competence protein ComEC/Rec2 [Paenibacillus sp. CAA11]
MLHRRPLVCAADCWIAGSGVAYLYSGFTFVLVCLGLILICPLVLRLAGTSYRQLFVPLFCFILAGAYWQYNESQNVTVIPSVLGGSGNAEDIESLLVSMSGTIVSSVERDGDRVDFTVSADSIAGSAVGSTSGGKEKATSKTAKSVHGEKLLVQVRLTEENEIKVASGWRRGQRIQVTGQLQKPQGSRNFEGFDYNKYLHTQHIHWLFKAAGAASVKVTEGGWSMARLLSWNDLLREQIGQNITAIFGERSAEYMRGLLIGETSGLDREIYDSFSTLGLTHILAISGTHVAINIGMLFWLLRRLRVTKEASYVIVLFFIPIYVMVTGLSPSVVRSGIMAMIGIYLLRKGLLKDGLHVLSATAWLMLLWEPYYLLNVSFQLSFIVTAGLIVYVPLLNRFFTFLPRRLAGAVSISVTAQLISFPITIYYFNQLSLLSLAANLVIVPASSLVSLPVGTAALLLSYIWLPLGRWLGYFVDWMNRATFVIAGWLDGLGQGVMIWGSPAIWWILSYYLLLYFLLYAGSRFRETKNTQAAPDETVPLNPQLQPPQLSVARRIKLGRLTLLRFGLASAMAALLILGYQPLYANGAGYVQFIDVGQGDCILVTTPGGKNILIDGGGTVSFRKSKDSWKERREPYEVGKKVVAPLLKKRGIHSLDAVIITHGDQDHAGGLQAVLEQIPVRALLLNGSLADTSNFKQLLRTALKSEVPVYSASRGMRMKLDALTELYFLNPSKDSSGSITYQKEQNGHSIVFLLEMDGARFLFTGDMDDAAEGEVLEALDKGSLFPDITGLPVDVLKIAHHGSKSSTTAEWLERWRPEAAVISVGEGNTYGHPHPTVIDLLSSHHTEVHRTDKMGEVQMEVKEGRIRYRHHLHGGG